MQPPPLRSSGKGLGDLVPAYVRHARQELHNLRAGQGEGGSLWRLGPSPNAVNDYRRCGRVRVARRAPASSSRLSEHPANLCAPPAASGGPLWQVNETPCREKDNGIFSRYRWQETLNSVAPHPARSPEHRGEWTSLSSDELKAGRSPWIAGDGCKRLCSPMNNGHTAKTRKAKFNDCTP